MTTPSTIQQVNEAVCEVFAVTAAQMRSRSRSQRVADARTAAIHFRHQWHLSLGIKRPSRGEIGRDYGLQGNAVGYALARHERFMQVDPAYAAKVARVEEMISRPTTKLETNKTTTT